MDEQKKQKIIITMRTNQDTGRHGIFLDVNMEENVNAY